MFRPRIELSDLPPASPRERKNRPKIPASRAIAIVLLCLLPAAVGWWAMHQTRATPARPCRPHDKPRVVVATAVKRLHLCRDGLSEADFNVALGYAGVGKAREGDGRTPLGTYTLAKARPSASGLHRFLHIGYPTRRQREAGLTGSAVGVHGPPRWAANLIGGLASWGATQGCVAVGRDAQVDRIAEWVSRHEVDRITIF